MRPALLMIPFVVLAACATPREQCINEVTNDTRVLGALIKQTERNLARGYALDQQQELRTVGTTCQGRNDDGTTFRFRCDETRTVTTTVPVAINLDAEQAKLETLRERFATEQAAANQAVAQCISVYPE